VAFTRSGHRAVTRSTKIGVGIGTSTQDGAAVFGENEIWNSRVLCLHRLGIVMTFRSLDAVGGILFATLRRRPAILGAISMRMTLRASDAG
jgi:hypothetical protein